MGYCTYYTVEVLDSNGNPANDKVLMEMGKKLNEIADDYFCDAKNYGNETIEDLVSYDSMKWYTHEEDMIELSRHYPSYRFNLYGEGEDHNDNWVEHFKNGRSVHRKGYIVYDAWNPDMLEWEED